MTRSLTTLVLVLLSACAAQRELAPSVSEVANLSPAMEPGRALLTYRVRYEPGVIVRPGDRHEGVAAEVPAWSPAAAEYLAASDAAAEAMSTPAIALDRIVNDARIDVAVPLGGAVVGAGVGVAAAGARDFTHSAEAGAVGALAGALAGIVTTATLQPTIAEIAAPDYKRAVRAFNRDLAKATQAASAPTIYVEPGSAIPVIVAARE